MRAKQVDDTTLTIAADAVGDWQRAYVSEQSEANLRGLFKAVRRRVRQVEEDAGAGAEFSTGMARRHFCERVHEHAASDPGTDDITRALNMADMLPDFERLYPSRGLSVGDLLLRCEWRAMDPSTPPYLVDGLFRRKGTSMVSADPKVGKSVLARCFGAAVSGGRGRFLGHECGAGPVFRAGRTRGKLRRPSRASRRPRCAAALPYRLRRRSAAGEDERSIRARRDLGA